MMSNPNPTPAVPVPATATPPAPVPSYDAAPPEVRAEIEQALTELDFEDSNAVLTFGTREQEEVTSVADEMLERVRSKDSGAAGQALNEMVSTLRGFSAQELDPQQKQIGRASCRERV